MYCQYICHMICRTAAIAAVLLMAACTDKGTLRIKGTIRNIQQADFFIYSPDGGISRLDTIHVIDGKFDWQTPLTEEATFIIVYPNFSEQVIFAQPGDVLKVSGDAGQLRQIAVEDSQDNEELTKFRLQNIDATPQQRTEAMQRYVKENPDTRVGIYLQRQLTLQNATFSTLRRGETLPAIQLPPDGLTDDTDTIFIQTKNRKEPTSIRQRPLLLLFWATWSGNSHSVNREARQLLTQTKDLPLGKRFQAINISLDVDLRTYHTFLRRDTMDWPTRCYRQAWNTQVTKQLGITNLPYIVLTDSARIIKALGSDWEKDIKPEIERMRAEAAKAK